MGCGSDPAHVPGRGEEGYGDSLCDEMVSESLSAVSGTTASGHVRFTGSITLQLCQEGWVGGEERGVVEVFVDVRCGLNSHCIRPDMRQ